MTKFRFVSLYGSLPPCIARKSVQEFLGGTVSAKTLANWDSLGLGPKNSIKHGKSVIYETMSLLEWLDERSENR